MPKPRGQAQDPIRSTKLVRSRYNDLQQHGYGGDVLPVMRWGITTASKLEALKVNKAAAAAALKAADDKAHNFKDFLLAELPPGKNLDKAISDQEDEIKHTQLHIEKLSKLQTLAKELAAGVALHGLHDSTNVQASAFDETKAGTVQISKERELNRLKHLKRQYEKRIEDRREKSEEADRIDDEFTSLMTDIEQVREFMNLLPANSAAMAKLPLPPLVPDGDE